ncbi:MAG: Zn-ribbon domain-containing OB-fold protein [Thaumarchaeota archaeon]|nr:Zn-ribbon domain-containing OB-fold protein [Nitrososphaerota archaeon]
MPLGERVVRVDELRAWTDQIPFRYEYTAGVAGEKFLRGLQQGKVLAANCEKCGKKYIPPRMYCVDDFAEIKQFRPVKGSGRVAALARSYYDLEGNKRHTPKTFVFISFDGVEGGLIHYGMGEGLKIGTGVIPKFRPASKRKWTVLDIEGFVKA